MDAAVIDIAKKQKELRKSLSVSASQKIRDTFTVGSQMSIKDRQRLDSAIDIKKESPKRTLAKEDKALREKKDALKEHLNKVEARKQDYHVVKGSMPKTKTGMSYASTSVSSTKATLKTMSKDFERIALKAASGSDDIGMRSIAVSLETAKMAMVTSSRMIAVNESIVKHSVKLAKGSVKVGQKTYKISATMFNAVKTGTVKGTLNIYKNMVFSAAGKAIKYSKPIYVAKNIGSGVKTFVLRTRYTISRNLKFVKGIASGKIKVSAKAVARYGLKSGINAGKTIYKGGRGVLNARIVRGSLKGSVKAVKGSLRNVGNLANQSDDMGMKTLGAAANGIRYSAMTAEVTGKAAVATAKGAYKTTRGIIRFAKDAKKYGIKGVSKNWYKAHIKGAGKRFGDKIMSKLKKKIKKLLYSPVLLGSIALIICAIVIINTAVISATSVVGGVVQFFEELAEGLQEVWDKVTTAIVDFFKSCVNWLVALFTGKKEEPVVNVDVDIGDNLSICEYLLGAVQLYKAKFLIDIQDDINKYLNDGCHSVIIYNNTGSEIIVNDISDPDKGLMTDKEYVKAILPIWKSIILGKIGTNFTGKEANTVTKDCFKALTKKHFEPYVDLNNDKKADYIYCDGSVSLNEGENIVYTSIGGSVIQEGSDTGRCYNSSGLLFHESHNPDGAGCCETTYFCGGHLTCKGHLGCPGHLTCYGHTDASGNLTYCEGCTTYYCGGCTSCPGHLTCYGHTNASGNLTYCEGCTTIYDTCLLSYCAGCKTEYCYTGTSKTPRGCSDEKSTFECKGYHLCKGHKLMKLTLGNYGLEKLLQEQFLDRISELEAKTDITAAESEELSQLRMFYEYAVGCDVYSDPISREFFNEP